MPPGVCTMRRKLPPNAVPNSGSPPVRQRSFGQWSSGPSSRLMGARLQRGAGSERRGEGIGSYLPPAQARDLFLQVSVDCNRARLNSRSAAAIFWASGVSDGIRPSGGSTIFEVRAPTRFTDKNIEL